MSTPARRWLTARVAAASFVVAGLAGAGVALAPSQGGSHVRAGAPPTTTTVTPAPAPAPTATATPPAPSIQVSALSPQAEPIQGGPNQLYLSEQLSGAPAGDGIAISLEVAGTAAPVRDPALATGAECTPEPTSYSCNGTPSQVTGVFGIPAGGGSGTEVITDSTTGQTLARVPVAWSALGE